MSTEIVEPAEPAVSHVTSSVAPARLLAFVTDTLVLFLLIGGAFEFFGRILGIHDRLAASIFTLLWLRGAVAKLAELRRGQWVAWRVNDPDRIEAIVMMSLGMTPWLIVQALHNGTPSWEAWQLATIPEWARACGACIAVALFVTSRAASSRATPSSRLLQGAGPTSCLLIAWLLVISSSAFVGLLAAGQLIALSMDRIRARETRHSDDVVVTLDSVPVPS